MDQSSDNAALDRLERRLREALSQRGKNDRAAATGQLKAILDFLYEKPRWTAEQIHRPLLDLWHALTDLDKGRRVPLLTPTTFKSRHPDDARRQKRRGHAIVAIEHLVALGETVIAAAEKVTKIWNKCTGETRAPGSIKSWYDRRDKIGKRDDLAKDVLSESRALWDPDTLDEVSANFVKNALRANELRGDLKDYLPRRAEDILEFLERVLTLDQPGNKRTG